MRRHFYFWFEKIITTVNPFSEVDFEKMEIGAMIDLTTELESLTRCLSDFAETEVRPDVREVLKEAADVVLDYAAIRKARNGRPRDVGQESWQGFFMPDR
jgi:hypothetical protein